MQYCDGKVSCHEWMSSHVTSLSESLFDFPHNSWYTWSLCAQLGICFHSSNHFWKMKTSLDNIFNTINSHSFVHPYLPSLCLARSNAKNQKSSDRCNREGMVSAWVEHCLHETTTRETTENPFGLTTVSCSRRIGSRMSCSVDRFSPEMKDPEDRGLHWNSNALLPLQRMPRAFMFVARLQSILHWYFF